MEEFLLRRLDKPWAWVITFGGMGIFGGAIAGGFGELPGGILGGAALVGITMGLVGGLFGILAGLICWWIGGLDQPVRRPDYWGRTIRCLACGWKSTPEGPISRRDCIWPPTECPVCSAGIIHHIPDCPSCRSPMMTGDGILKDMFRLVRWPKTLGQAFYGHYLCKSCRCEYDRWGRNVLVGLNGSEDIIENR